MGLGIGHDPELLHGAEIAGIQHIEADVRLLKMGKDSPHFLCQIEERVPCKSARVGGEQGRGENDGFHTGGGEDGQCHGVGAFAKAGDILHG